MGKQVALTVMPQGQKANFDTDKIMGWGKSEQLDGSVKNWVMYEGQQVVVAESKEELNELLS